MRNPILPFAIATLLPVLLLIASTFLGGWWTGVTLLYFTLFAFLVDQIMARLALANARSKGEGPAIQLSQTLALVHFPLLALVVWALSGGLSFEPFNWLMLFLSFGAFFGQVSNSNAHELIHRTNKRLFSLGKWVYISLLFGHHTSAHLRVHHRYVATLDDPNTAALGENFYGFAARAWWGSFQAGYEIENAFRQRAGLPRFSPRHPYTTYVLGALAMLTAAFALGGWRGTAVLICLAAFAQTQLLLVDYVQHYGLTRRIGNTGNPEPIAPKHAWDGRHWFSALLTLNAPRHSEHHCNPTRSYQKLRRPGSQSPNLPFSLPTMTVLALSPRHFRRVMDPRAKAWMALDHKTIKTEPNNDSFAKPTM